MQNKFSKINFKQFLDKNPSRVFEGGKRFENKPNLYDHLGPKITIITVIKNKADYIEETILSIKNQNYKNIEYIVIDGVSTDGSIDIVKKYLDNIDYFVSEPDDGNYDAINKGISLSTGDLIGIVNADDILLGDATEILLEYYNKYSECDFFFGSVRKHWGVISGYKPYKIKYSWFFYTSHSTGFFIKRNAAEKNGKYSLKYKYSSDFDYFYRLIVHNKFKGIATKKNEIFGIFRPGGISHTLNKEDHFFEKIQIRIDNKQNKLFILMMFVVKYLINLKSNNRIKINKFLNFLKLNFL
jgi:glycosyltransferase involved in cell wall biosynthesis